MLAVALAFIIFSALWDLCHGAKVGGEWVPLGPFDGGINTSSNRGQLTQSQFLSSSNFIWKLDSGGRGDLAPTGHLEAREGFYRMAAPESGNPVEFIDVFRSPSGLSYLFYSDGAHLWYRTNLTETPVSLDFGRVNAGTVRTISGSPYVFGNNLSTQKWRTVLGPGIGSTMTINDVEYTVKAIIGDTLVLLDANFSSTEATATYNMDVATVQVNAAYQVNNAYWVFTNVGKFRFDGPGAFTVVDSVTGARYQYTAAVRHCLGTAPTLKFTASSVTSDFSGQFARIVTNPFSQGTPNCPVPADRPMYMSLPVYSSGSGLVYTLGAAFGPKDATAQYLTVEPLVIDTSSKATTLIDSVQVLVADSANFSCSGNYNLYLKLFCDTCNWQSDTTRFISGDYFVSPQVTTTTLGKATTQGVNGQTNLYNTIIAAKVTTPNKQAIKAYRMFAAGVSSGLGGLSTHLVKGAIYKVSDSSLVDTTVTLAETFNVTSFVELELTFAEAVDLAPSTDYYVALWADSNFFQGYNQNLTGLQSVSKAATYTGTFPNPLSGATQSSRQYVFWLDADYYDPAAPLMTSATNCLPVVGGYVASDSTILAAVASVAPSVRTDWSKAWNRMRDRDTCRVVLFRMTKEHDNAAEGIEFAVWHNSVNFEVRSNHKDYVYWSEVNQPDSFITDHVIIIDHGNPLVVGAPQNGNVVFYTATNRWALVYGGGGSYGKQYLDGVRGCIARRSFLNIDGVHYGLASDGYWETSGEAPALISGAVASFFTDSLDFSRLNDVAAGYDAENDNIWISQKDNFTLVYNRASRSWWPQTFVAGAYYYNSDINVSDSIRFIAGGADSSMLYVRGGDDDDGDSLVAEMQTGFNDYGVSQLIKNVKGLRLGFEAERATGWACESYGQNYATGASYSIGTFTGATISGWGEQQMRFLQGLYRGHRLSHKLTFYNASGLKLPYLQALVQVGNEEN